MSSNQSGGHPMFGLDRNPSNHGPQQGNPSPFPVGKPVHQNQGTVNEVPQIGGGNQVPIIGAGGGMQGMPNMPHLSNFAPPQGMPNMPQQSNFPPTQGMANTPHLSNFAPPQGMPNMPQQSNFPPTQGMGNMPQQPNFPPTQGMGNMPQQPNFPPTQGMGNTPHLSNFAPPRGMPNMPQQPNFAPPQGVPNMPAEAADSAEGFPDNYFDDSVLTQKEKDKIIAINDLVVSMDNLCYELIDEFGNSEASINRDNLQGCLGDIKKFYDRLAVSKVPGDLKIDYGKLRFTQVSDKLEKYTKLCSSCHGQQSHFRCTCMEYFLCNQCIEGMLVTNSNVCPRCNKQITIDQISDSSIQRDIKINIMRQQRQFQCVKCSKMHAMGGNSAECNHCREIICESCLRVLILKESDSETIEWCYTCLNCFEKKNIPLYNWKVYCKGCQKELVITECLEFECQGELHCLVCWYWNLKAGRCLSHNVEVDGRLSHKLAGYFLLNCKACKTFGEIPYGQNYMCQFGCDICLGCLNRFIQSKKCPACNNELVPF